MEEVVSALMKVQVAVEVALLEGMWGKAFVSEVQ